MYSILYLIISYSNGVMMSVKHNSAESIDTIISLASKNKSLRDAIINLANYAIQSLGSKNDGPKNYADESKYNFESGYKRCRLKADAALWSRERREMLDAGADFNESIDPKDKEFIRLAKTIPNCFIWTARAKVPSDLAYYTMLAGCYTNLAESLFLLQRVPDDVPEFRDTLELCAESQSALREAILQNTSFDDHMSDDRDQTGVYHALRELASRHKMFIGNYMRITDKADPHGYEALFKELQEYVADFESYPVIRTTIKD